MDFLIDLYKSAVASCQPHYCMPAYLTQFDPNQPICVLGAGKAAAGMAAEVHRYFGDNCYGAVVTRYGYETHAPTGNIAVISAAHPLPDENSLVGGQRLLSIAQQVDDSTPVLFLVSGGGSALASVPAGDITPAEKLAVHRFLLRSGAAIEEMNTVRKQLSAIKGGRLAAHCQGPKHSLVISDVVGDDPTFIASGMTVQDTSCAQEAQYILEKYHWQPIPSVVAHLKQQHPSPKVGGHYDIIASAKTAIDSAASLAQSQGWHTEIISYTETGEASEVARKHAALALKAKQRGQKTLLFSGGELTVTLGDSQGDGGPNQEYLLALAIALDSAPGITALSADTDGVDGSKDVAGGMIKSTTLADAKRIGVDPVDCLSSHNSYWFFDALQQHLIVEPTRTNVNDFRVIAIE